MEMKAKRMSSDIITTLPQGITEKILCLLPIEEAARTSILAKEWRYKWTKIPVLSLTMDLAMRRITGNQTSEMARARKNMYWKCRFLYIIHQVLLMRQAPIQEFNLVIEADGTCYEIDQILLHLSTNHNVKILDICWMDESCSYNVPVSLFSFRHLTSLCLEYCTFNHKPVFDGFSSLTSLTLKATISRESLLHLLSKCPLLKSLSLHILEENYSGYEKINIVELFKCLPVIENLTTEGYIIALVRASVSKELPALVNPLRYFRMELMGFADVYELTFLANLLQLSPNLEKINIEIVTYSEYDPELDILKGYSGVFKEYSDVQLELLNELNIVNFRNFNHEVELVKFILARSPKLKKVILLTRLDDKNEELELLSVLLHVPRVSPVEIIIKHGHKDL